MQFKIWYNAAEPENLFVVLLFAAIETSYVVFRPYLSESIFVIDVVSLKTLLRTLQ